MRFRVNMRDIFWYRKAQVLGNKVYDATPIFRSQSPSPNTSSGQTQIPSQVSNSVLDVWDNRVKRLFSIGPHHNVKILPLLSRTFD